MKTIKGKMNPIITLKYSSTIECKYPIRELVEYLTEIIPNWHIETQIVDQYAAFDISAFVFFGIDESLFERNLREDAEIAICKKVGNICQRFVSDFMKKQNEVNA